MGHRRGVFLVYKGINHVKLTVTDAGVAAKAYAGVTCSLMQDPPPDSEAGKPEAVQGEPPPLRLESTSLTEPFATNQGATNQG